MDNKTEQTCATYGCGITFWTASGFDDRRRDDKKNFYCPNGHAIVYIGKSDRQIAGELRMEKARLENEVAGLERQLKHCKPAKKKKK